MDIQETYAFIENNFTKKNLQTFKKQIALSQVEPTAKLKDYLDSINDDPVQWLSSFPNDLTSKSAFHQYKEPVYKLLKHTQLHEDYGENYCVNLMNNIKQAFTINCQDIIDKRKDNKKPTEIITFDDSSSESDIESNDNSELDINTLVPVDKKPTKDTIKQESTDKTNNNDIQNINVENNNELQNQIKLLQDKLVMQEKYYESIIEYYKNSFNLLTNTNEQLMKLLAQITSK